MSVYDWPAGFVVPTATSETRPPLRFNPVLAVETFNTSLELVLPSVDWRTTPLERSKLGTVSTAFAPPIPGVTFPPEATVSVPARMPFPARLPPLLIDTPPGASGCGLLPPIVESYSRESAAPLLTVTGPLLTLVPLLAV